VSEVKSTKSFYFFTTTRSFLSSILISSFAIIISHLLTFFSSLAAMGSSSSSLPPSPYRPPPLPLPLPPPPPPLAPSPRVGGGLTSITNDSHGECRSGRAAQDGYESANSQFLNKIVHVDDENDNNDYDFSDEEYAGQLAIVEVRCRCYF
jgi:hypothetical protein